MASTKVRLDQAVTDAGLVDSRSRARAMILAGDVLVNGEAVLQAGKPVGVTDVVELRAKPRFVSRGGDKLDHALSTFDLDVAGFRCADLGASTGGFTDCLLQRGAAHVTAIDVGYGQIDLRLRDDPRVTVVERVNVRYPQEGLSNLDLVVIDVSFISLNLVLPTTAAAMRDGGWCVPLIKPQFEVGKGEVGKGGVVRDAATHRRVVERVLDQATSLGLAPVGLTRSPVVGPAGNVEFLALLKLGASKEGRDRSALLASAGLDDG